MKFNYKIIKRKLAALLIVSMSINCFATSVSDNDGSAFITKAEFDALKSSFQAQLDTYNQGIDSKIDSAIASYLAGINVSKERIISLPVTISTGTISCVSAADLPVTWGHLAADVYSKEQGSEQRDDQLLYQDKEIDPWIANNTPRYGEMMDAHFYWDGSDNIIPCITKTNHDDEYGIWAGYRVISDSIKTNQVLIKDGCDTADINPGGDRWLSCIFPSLPTGHYENLGVIDWCTWGEAGSNGAHRQTTMSAWTAVSNTITTITKAQVFDNIITWGNEYIDVRNISGAYDWVAGTTGDSDIDAYELYKEAMANGVVGTYSIVRAKSLRDQLATITNAVFVQAGDNWVESNHASNIALMQSYKAANIGSDYKVYTFGKIINPLIPEDTLGISGNATVVAGLPVCEIKSNETLKWNITFDKNTKWRIFFNDGPFSDFPNEANCLKWPDGKKYYEFTGTTSIMEFKAENNANIWMKWAEYSGTTLVGGGDLKVPVNGDLVIKTEN